MVLQNQVFLLVYFQDNYWLCNNTTWRKRSSLDLDSNEEWIKFVADLDGGEQGRNFLIKECIACIIA